ncbi:MAG: hypothetical protein LBB50_05280 [Oscillospiraceae bacterium]|jgi:hypothetical protein|nr:hypothetical protein [Oscillospiraceae bacterium]
MIVLKRPDALLVDNTFCGGSQHWYKRLWQRMGGCGATAASLLIWYLAQTNPKYSTLCTINARSKNEFLDLMNEMFTYITPRWRGVDSSAKFIAGLFLYLQEKEERINGFCCFDVEPKLCAQPDAEHFVENSLKNDRPVAFLNLQSGNQKHLDGWHWMVVIAFDPDSGEAHLCDQGKCIVFSLREWVQSTKRGGAFVSINEI